MSTIIDLHLHSDFSDGRQSPELVVKLAVKNGVKYLAMADHESTHSLEAVRATAKKVGIQSIVGVEITTVYNGATLHLLGYNFDPHNEHLQTLSKILLANRKSKIIERMEKVAEKLEEQGKGKLDIGDFATSQKGFFNRWKAEDYLVDRGLVKNKWEAGRYLLGVKIAAEEVSLEFAIDLVHKAGGVAVLAHCLGPKISLNKITQDTAEQTKIIAELKESGLDGLECYQPSHEPEDTKQTLKWAKQFDLLVTAGSDWHGPLQLTGKGILEYIPNYASGPGRFDVPEEVQRKMIKQFVK